MMKTQATGSVAHRSQPSHNQHFCPLGSCFQVGARLPGAPPIQETQPGRGPRGLPGRPPQRCLLTFSIQATDRVRNRGSVREGGLPDTQVGGRAGMGPKPICLALQGVSCHCTTLPPPPPSKGGLHTTNLPDRSIMHTRQEARGRTSLGEAGAPARWVLESTPLKWGPRCPSSPPPLVPALPDPLLC